MIAIDLGHRFGRLGRTGPDGRPEVTGTRFEDTDGVREPARALPALLAVVPAGTASLGERPAQAAVLGLPASGGREDELRRAAEHAGLLVERVVPDPVAVALHYGAVAEGVDRTVLVCDQGATALDLTVLAITPDLTVRVVRTRSHRLGGDHWDEALAAHLAGRLPDGADPRRTAESLRRGLGAGDRVIETVTDRAGDEHRLILDRADFEQAVAPLRDRTLDEVSEELTGEPAIDTVLLAGGLSATPGRRSEIARLPAAQGLTVRCDRPELAVVHGLLALQHFGVLRIDTGPAPRTSRAYDGYDFPEPEPLPDPDPLTRPPLPDDPDPVTRPAPPVGATTTPDPTPPPGPATVPPPRREPEQPQQPERPEPSEPPQPHPSPPSPPPLPPATPDASTPPPPPTDPRDPHVSQPATFVAVPVGQLQALRRGDHLLVLWAWPEGALSARVRWRREGGSAGGGPRDGDLI
ncbi:Hsp70 family protein, partial [Streptomyces monashensis]|uniref:Hsp70 family protein n=1 Tax=Streptomyces monashensis TaxID=1678012 RepID=UPI0015A52ABA